MNRLEIIIAARSLRSLEKVSPNLTTAPARSLIWSKSSPYRKKNARGIGFRFGYSFRASAASEQRVNVWHKPMVWHIGTLKYSHQHEKSKAFIELPTEKSLRVINSFTQIAIVRLSTAQRDVQNRW